MKQIKPIQIWSNGQLKTASELDARIINDDLQSSCTFYWELKEETTGLQLAQGNVTMSGQDYDDWDGDNNLAYAYIAEQINVVIL